MCGGVAVSDRDWAMVHRGFVLGLVVMAVLAYELGAFAFTPAPTVVRLW